MPETQKGREEEEEEEEEEEVEQSIDATTKSLVDAAKTSQVPRMPTKKPECTYVPVHLINEKIQAAQRLQLRLCNVMHGKIEFTDVFKWLIALLPLYGVSKPMLNLFDLASHKLIFCLEH